MQTIDYIGGRMNFSELVNSRQSCRKYHPTPVEREKLDAVMAAARLAPSACNGQPYRITLCQGDAAKRVARACMGMGMNKFAADAPVLIVISEEAYVPSAAFGSKVKKNDYRSIDIGLLAAHITFMAAELGLGTCMLGWFDDAAVREVTGSNMPTRLVITLGYPADAQRTKKRKDISELVTEVE